MGNHVFLKVSPLKGRFCFSHKGKLTPRFIKPFGILQRIGPVAYRLALPPSPQRIHDDFYVSNLRQYVLDPSHVIQYERLQLKEILAYIEEPMKILDRMERTLQNRTIPFVKVL